MNLIAWKILPTIYRRTLKQREWRAVMGLIDRIKRVIRANTNDLVSKAEDPEKVLEQTVA